MEEGAARGRSVSRLNVLIAITAAIIGLISGYDLGSIAGALHFLVPAFDLSTFMTSVVTSAVVLGQVFGALFARRISNTPSGASALWCWSRSAMRCSPVCRGWPPTSDS